MWRLLDTSYDQNAPLNLALEEAIARKVGEGAAPNTVRFWKNNNAVVLGCFQSAALELNLEACKRHGVAIVRRFTGGGAVYHDSGNLNYSVSVRRDTNQISDAFGGFLKVVSLGVIEGLKAVRIGAEVRSMNVIEVEHRKVSGLAGSAKWGAFFVHGSILVNSDLNVLSIVLDAPIVPTCERYVRSCRRDVDNLGNILHRKIRVSEIKRALAEGFERTFAPELARGSLLKEEADLAERLYNEKYSIEEIES